MVRASRDGIRVPIVNQGPSRGEPYASLIVDAPLGAVLPAVAGSVAATGGLAAVGGPGQGDRGAAGDRG